MPLWEAGDSEADIHPERDSGYTQVLPPQGDWSGHPETVATHKCCPLKEAKVDIHRETVATHKCCPPRRLEWSSRDSGYTHKCCPLKETGVVIQRQWLYTQVLPTQGDWSGHPETVAIHTSVAHSRRLEWSSRDSGYTHKCCPLKETGVVIQRQWLYTQVLPTQGDWSGHPETVAIHTSVAPSRRLEWSSRDSGYTQVLPPQGG